MKSRQVGSKRFNEWSFEPEASGHGKMHAEKCPPDLSTSGILVTSAESVPGKVGLRSNAEAREEIGKTKCRQLFQHKEVMFRESSRVKEWA